MPEQPVHWYQSQRFIALCQSTAVYVLGWLAAALASNDWAWRAMAVGVLGNVIVALKDWWNPNIIAPFSVLNRNNTPTVSASSVRDAEKTGGS
jgi:hypothetical protein